MKTVWKQMLTTVLVLTLLFSSVLPGVSSDLKAAAFDQKSFTVTKTLNDAFSAENSGNGGISLFSASSSYDGCFGNQLEEEAKEIYDHFVSTYAVNRQAGELTYTFSSPFTFQTAIVDGKFDENEEYQEIYETISVAFQSAMDAFLYDYPDVFWFKSGSYLFGISFSGSSYSNVTGTISSAVFTPDEIYSGAASKISSYDDKVSETVNAIRESVGTEADRMTILKYVHDYICNNAYYNSTDELKVHSSEPFFIGDGGVVCEGYAKTFKVLCDKLSLPCACVSGIAKTSDGTNEAHMWNVVQMEDGKWYLVDVTWDDQTSKIYDTYFLAGSSSAGFNDIISKERTESTDFSSTGCKNFVYPVLSSDKYTPHVHNWNTFYTVDTAATCTQSGSKSIHCSLCSEQKNITLLPALGHDFTEKITDNAHLKSSATCTKKAEYYYDCSRCSQISGTEYYEYGDALGHDMGNWYVSTASTCILSGESKRDCNRCSYSETQTLQPTYHMNQYAVQEQAATCKASGYTAGVYCPDCKTWLSGHEVIPVKEHTYVEYVTAPTCTVDGGITYTCSVCGDSYTDSTVPDLGHSFTNYVSDNNATCKADGTKTAKCDRCDATDTIADEGTKLTHTPSEAVKENEKAATCTEDGSYDLIVYCSVCHTELGREEKTTEKLGHSFTNYVSDNNATCTQDGTKTAKCDRCDVTDTIADEDSMKAHTESAWITDKDSDCVNGGTKHTECTVCHTVIKTEAIPANGHQYVDTVTAPTCTTAGYTVHTCSVCGNTYTDSVVPATGHQASEAVKENIVAATCTANGSYDSVVYCSVCHAEISCNSIVTDKLSHSYQTKTTPATTAKDGKIVTACTVCGKVSKTVPIYKASSITLLKTSFTYNGKVQKPAVTVKNSKGTTLKNNTDYTVSYSAGCKNTGKYAVKITFKGNYSGSKTLYFNILPSKTSKLTATQTTSSIKATWNKVTGASGYKVTLYNSSGKAVKAVYATKTTYTFSKLSKGTTYKVRVTAYKTIDGKKVSSSVYTQLTTVTKPGTPTLKVTAGSKKATLAWNKQTGATGYVIYMATSQNGKYSKIATLKGNSKVAYTKTGLTKGKTYYFKVAAYTVANGKTLYSSFSSVKSVKIK
ncbi:MAG: fibronectin type III domain-containing protein [Acutalibacteraceae bacterium]